MGRWSQAIAGAAQDMFQEKRTRDEAERVRLQRIREHLSLTNAQAPEQTRVLPGDPEILGIKRETPEQVERYQRKYRYNADRGEYEGYDEPISREANEWADVGTDIKAAGGQLLTTRTQRDRAGRERSTSELSPVAPKRQPDVVRTEGGERVTYEPQPDGSLKEVARGARNLGTRQSDEAIRSRGEAQDQRSRKLAADKKVAARLSRLRNNPEERAAELEAYGNPTMAQLADSYRAEEYQAMGLKSHGVGAPEQSKPPGSDKKPIPPDVLAKIKQAQELGASNDEIKEALRQMGYGL